MNKEQRTQLEKVVQTMYNDDCELYVENFIDLPSIDSQRHLDLSFRIYDVDEFLEFIDSNISIPYLFDDGDETSDEKLRQNIIYAISDYGETDNLEEDSGLEYIGESPLY